MIFTGSRRHHWSRLGSFFLAAISLGCGSFPVPQFAVENTTVTIPIPHTYNAGFGRALSNAMGAGSLVPTLPTVAYSSSSGLEDEVRGELVLQLTDRNYNPITYLRVRHITRVHADEASRAAFPDTGAAYAKGQVLAFVDIPKGVVNLNAGSSDFHIYVTRFLRDPNTLAFFEDRPQVGSLDWRGWGTLFPIGPIPIKIIETGETQNFFNPFTGFEAIGGNYSSYDVEGDLDRLVPRPKVPVQVLNGATPAPAAWRAEISYPREKVAVVGAEAITNEKSTTTVLFEPDTVATTGCVPAQPGTVGVSVVDPNRKTPGVRLVLEPRALDCPAFTSQLEPSDFAEVGGSVVAYDADGADISSGWSLAVGGLIE